MGKIKIELDYEKIRDAIRVFDQQEKIKEMALDTVFNNFPYNNDESTVLIKVATLNTLYSAGLNDYAIKSENASVTIDISAMAKHIAEESRFDEWLRSPNKEDRMKAFNHVALENKKGYRKARVFASKYCGWHLPDVYPISDSLSRGVLYCIYNTKSNDFLDIEKVTRDDLLDYDSFVQIYESFVENVNRKYGENYNYKSIDKFLWITGKNNPEVAIS